MHCPEAGERHPIKVFPKMKVAHSLSLSLSVRPRPSARDSRKASGGPSQVPFLTNLLLLLLPSLVFLQALIFVPTEQPPGLKLLPLAKLDSNHVTTNRLYWTRDSMRTLFLFIRNLGIRPKLGSGRSIIAPTTNNGPSLPNFMAKFYAIS